MHFIQDQDVMSLIHNNAALMLFPEDINSVKM